MNVGIEQIGEDGKTYKFVKIASWKDAEQQGIKLTAGIHHPTDREFYAIVAKYRDGWWTTMTFSDDATSDDYEFWWTYYTNVYPSDRDSWYEKNA